MPLKNYTSSVPVDRSISYIESKLAKAGAREILKMYDPDGRVEGIAFNMPVGNTNMTFKLPAKILACETVLRASVRRPNSETEKRIKEQAERTAWKIVYDWVEVQMAMIELTQTEFFEVFMPYLYNHVTKQTYFQIVKEKGLQKLLPEAISNS